MQTWLVIFRGNPMDGGVPIGVVNDRELCLAAVRAAWAAFRSAYEQEGSDPVLRKGIEGVEGRLRAAAAELDGALTARRPRAQKAHARFRTLSRERICSWEECGIRFTPAPRQRGSRRKFCSAACRRAAWRARHENWFGPEGLKRHQGRGRRIAAVDHVRREPGS